MNLRLHYAPDNASLVIRLALEHLGLPYETRLVDRRARAQRRPEYLRLNPNGLIPALETDEGPIFETGAILLWLDERHGGLLPQTGRGAALSWLFWLSNTLHPKLIDLFYRERAAPEALADAVYTRTRERAEACLDLLETRIADWPEAVALDAYLMPMLRWLALYPVDRAPALDLARWPGIRARALAFEATEPSRRAAAAEGLGARPWTAPEPANPPEGSAQ